MPIAQVHGAEMDSEEVGSGPPLLLSPGGWQGVLASDQPVIAALSQAHRVIAYDRRFGGQSTSPLVVQTWDMGCQDVIGLLDVLSIETAYLGGGSCGAAIAFGCAVRSPQRVRAIFPSNIAGGLICHTYLAMTLFKRAEMAVFPAYSSHTRKPSMRVSREPTSGFMHQAVRGARRSSWSLATCRSRSCLGRCRPCGVRPVDVLRAVESLECRHPTQPQKAATQRHHRDSCGHAQVNGAHHPMHHPADPEPDRYPHARAHQRHNGYLCPSPAKVKSTATLSGEARRTASWPVRKLYDQPYVDRFLALTLTPSMGLPHPDSSPLYI